MAVATPTSLRDLWDQAEDKTDRQRIAEDYATHLDDQELYDYALEGIKVAIGSFATDDRHDITKIRCGKRTRKMSRVSSTIYDFPVRTPNGTKRLGDCILPDDFLIATELEKHQADGAMLKVMQYGEVANLKKKYPKAKRGSDLPSSDIERIFA